MKRTLLLTGASGFTGRYVLGEARNAGYRCVALCQRPGEAVDAHATLTANLLDSSSLRQALDDAQPDVVVHLAAVAFVAHDDIGAIYENNLIGTVNLLEAIGAQAPGVERVVVASSANIYGNASELPITETTPVAPANHYGVSKAAMETAAGLYRKLPLTIVRPFNYTGAGQSPSFLVPKIVDAFRRRVASIELGNLDVSRDFCDVRDVARAYIRLLSNSDGHSVFNLCSGQATALRAIIDILERLTGHTLEIRSNPAFVRADEIRTLYGSPARLEEAIGNYRQYSLEDTLRWMLDSEATH